MTVRLKISVAYFGAPFHGWQRQNGQRTVQGELEKAFRPLTRGQKVTVVGAGRTDAGVHAVAQTAHADLPCPIPPEKVVQGLNSRLPAEIRVRSVLPVSPSFHARNSSRGKLYTYRVRWRENSLPWFGLRSTTIPKVKDEGSLAEAVALLPGRRDWASFSVTHPGPPSTVRSLFRVRSRALGDGIDFEFVGDGFLRYQVRRLVGALLEVGLQQRTLENFEQLITIPQPGARIRTAPAKGLTLERVYYRKSAALRFKPDGRS